MPHDHDHPCDAVFSPADLDAEDLYDLADLFKIFGDSTRLGILFALLEGEKKVCDIAKELEMTLSAISHQLRTLKQSRLVKSRREGKNVFYSLDDDHVSGILRAGMAHILHTH
ncbi:MAG: helix-turn-helix transcriptional regulator [Ruminococcaceae bacterium]|nr:helix-turn-helix transcriptional regulator [Oscillospiraceae bacterium]